MNDHTSLYYVMSLETGPCWNHPFEEEMGQLCRIMEGKGNYHIEQLSVVHVTDYQDANVSLPQ